MMCSVAALISGCSSSGECTGWVKKATLDAREEEKNGRPGFLPISSLRHSGSVPVGSQSFSWLNKAKEPG